MTMHRWIQRAIPAAAVALVGAAPLAGAQQGQQLFEWNGRVDREVQIVMRGNQLRTNNVGPTEPGRERARSFSALPRQDGQISVQVLNGRGNVNVVQQPNAGNGYTAIVRIDDPSGGSAPYRIIGYWQPYANGDVYRNGRYDRRDRDNRRDRDRDNGRYGSNGNVYTNGRPNQTMLHWSGNVDDDLEIRIQNGRISYRNLSGAQPTSIRADAGYMSVPRVDASVAVMQNQGRGSVQLVQQPSARNGYTTIIRVRDPQRGYGYYDFDLMWQ